MRARLIPVLLLLLVAACATPYRVKVARFQSMPAPAGQAFVIQPRDARMTGSLEFAQYANLVRDRLAAYGYQQAASATVASLVVTLDYGISQGREKIVSRPSYYGGFGYGYWPHGGWGYPYYRHPYWGGGYYDPFWGGWGGWGYPEVYSYTVYSSFLDMRVTRASDNQSVFEGRAEATTRTNDLARLVPNLIAAMFTDFPGRSGETVRVNIPQEKRSY